MQNSSGNPDAIEVNFDGLIGPTHNYAGLAPGNLASMSHQRQTSNPRAAAQQGLQKMRRLHALGVPQAVLPPQQRPNLALLRRLGFVGNDEQVLHRAGRDAPHLLAAAMSGSSMWSANAATICPSADSGDGKVHLTPANLVSSLHRASETNGTATILKRVFSNARFFVHHPPLPAASDLGDEGAANHTRFCSSFGDPGVQLFVFGSERHSTGDALPKRFAARQSAAASKAVARLHGLSPDRVVFAKQCPAAIDAGVFHNDVIAVGHRHTLLCHENAFANAEAVYASLRQATGGMIRIAEVPAKQLSLKQAVSSYLFNSQIVTAADERTILIAPQECRGDRKIDEVLSEWTEHGFIDAAEYVDLGQSMNNGGGPACLRLRVVLNDDQLASISRGLLFSDTLADRLSDWIDRHYRDSLSAEDLYDPMLLRRSYQALDQLTQILGLGALYDFQQS